jgi:chromosome segregation ATPase
MIYRLLLCAVLLWAAEALPDVRSRRHKGKRFRIPINVEVTVRSKHARRGERRKVPATKQVQGLTRRTRALESGVKKLEKAVDVLGQKFEEAPLTPATSQVAGQILGLARRVEELEKRVEEKKEPIERGTAAINELQRRVQGLTAELTKQKESATSYAQLSQEETRKLTQLQGALYVYVTSEENMLQARNDYLQDLSEESRGRLAQAWQTYTESVEALNTILRELGMVGREIPINEAYYHAVQSLLPSAQELPAG